MRRLLLACALVALATAGCDEERLIQGPPVGTKVDAFVQTKVSKVDVLWVIDNSNSMFEEQQNLARNFDAFMEYLKKGKVEYHIAVTTTDYLHNGGALLGDPQVLKWNDPRWTVTYDAASEFKTRALVGIGGTAAEEAFTSAEAALLRATTGFLRPDAHLYIIFLSDEEEDSVGEVKYYWRTFEQKRGIGNEGTVSVSAIVGDVPGGCASAEPGTRYKALAEMTGGILGSVCAPQFDETLRNIGLAAAGLRRKFGLSRKPDLDTLDVVQRYPCDADLSLVSHCEKVRKECADPAPVDRRAMVCFPKKDLPGGWVYEETSNSIFFDGTSIPSFGAIVEVTYQEPRPEGT